jgi:hypothetical protein
MADDHLKNCSVDQLAAWYLRLAAAWDRNMPELQPPLAGAFLRTWVNNRSKDAKIEFDAPPHLRSHPSVFAVQAFHREVFLTNKKARFSGGNEKWAGILPRIQGAPGFSKWDMKGDLALEYESLCDVAPDIWAIAKIQRSGSNADRDIFGSLRGFQLKSRVTVGVVQPPGTLLKVMFKTWVCSGTDRYDWNYSEYLTVVNPDFGSKAPDAIRPQDRTLTVFHSNAKRLEAAGKAAPYQVILKPWTVADARLAAQASVDIKRRL